MRVHVAVIVTACAGLALSAHAQTARDAPLRKEQASSHSDAWDDTGRFYLLFQTGLVFRYDDGFAGDAHVDSHDLPGSNVDVPINLAIGYNISRHFGVELQGFGTEPDIVSDSRGKLAEYSNITVFGALRYRHPLGDGRLVPWALGGVGWSLNALNDVTNTSIKLKGDGSTIAGTLAAGFDYFLNRDVAVGASVQTNLYPDIGTEALDKQTGVRTTGDINLTSTALLLHVRVFPGWSRDGADASEPAHPYDTDERRYYLFGVAGDHLFFDDGYGGGVTAKSAGSSNWTLGGGGGVNLDGHWSVELAMLSDSDLNIMNGVQGKIGEMGIFTILPAARYRWQFWRGRLVPYVTAGVGAAITRPNDPRNLVDVYLKGTQRTPKYEIQSASVAGMVGVGLEFFLNHHVSLGLGVPLVIYPDWETTVQQRNAAGASVGRPVRGSWNYTGIFPNVRLTAYIP